MYALALSAPEHGALRDHLVASLADRYAVAVVERAPAIDATDAAAATVRVDDAGRYTATGAADDLDALVASLAPDHDLAFLVGFDDVSLPRVVVGEDPGALVSAGRVEDVDPDAVESALAGIEPIETLESLVARVKAAPGTERAGAIATFTGRVRARDDPGDVETTALEFEKYEGVADERMAALEAELAERDGVFDVVMHHVTGVVEAGEDVVFVVVLAGHREEAFRTVADGIDRLKAEVPLFKKEVTVEESFWVHDRA